MLIIGLRACLPKSNMGSLVPAVRKPHEIVSVFRNVYGVLNLPSC